MKILPWLYIRIHASDAVYVRSAHYFHFTVNAKQIGEAQDILDGTSRSTVSGKQSKPTLTTPYMCLQDIKGLSSLVLRVIK